MGKYSRPSNCENLIVPSINAEIWDKLDNKTKYNDPRATSTQKILAKVGSILALTIGKYSRPSDSEKRIVPSINAEIWDKPDNNTNHNDLRATSTQKILVKVGSILAETTDKLLPMRNADSPDVDQLITMNADALALLDHRMCEQSYASTRRY